MARTCKIYLHSLSQILCPYYPLHCSPSQLSAHIHIIRKVCHSSCLYFMLLMSSHWYCSLVLVCLFFLYLCDCSSKLLTVVFFFPCMFCSPEACWTCDTILKWNPWTCGTEEAHHKVLTMILLIFNLNGFLNYNINW